MKLLETISFVLGAILVSALTIFMVSFLVIMIDMTTSKQIGTESVPCIDDRGRPFENELCGKKIRCSWLGFATSMKCSDVKLDIKGENHDE